MDVVQAEASPLAPVSVVNATLPPGITDLVSGEAIGTETIRYGQRITVVALPPPAVFLSPKGLAHVGPRAFGYDLDFKSVFAA